eukprot:SAG31_NODE_82_length_27046_cov_45.857275_10_plen_183_part_00
MHRQSSLRQPRQCIRLIGSRAGEDIDRGFRRTSSEVSQLDKWTRSIMRTALQKQRHRFTQYSKNCIWRRRGDYGGAGRPAAICSRASSHGVQFDLHASSALLPRSRIKPAWQAQTSPASKSDTESQTSDGGRNGNRIYTRVGLKIAEIVSVYGVSLILRTCATINLDTDSCSPLFALLPPPT